MTGWVVFALQRELDGGIAMIKVICDKCGKDGASNKFSYLCHLEREQIGYVDKDFNRVSGRTIEKDLCNKCYNDIVGLAVTALLKDWI